MTAPWFMFATGIENSYPTIKNGTVRVDEMDKCGHYQNWRTDFQLVQELDIRFLRYGPAIHRTWIGHKRYDWSFVDVAFRELKRLNIVPIVDLCHFGVPDWIGDFQNPDFPQLFEYAGTFARRFPWVQLYTPVTASVAKRLPSSAMYVQRSSERSQAPGTATARPINS